VTRALTLLLASLVAIGPARADDQDGRPPNNPIDAARKAYARGDYETARKLLLEAYEIEPFPKLLFALGQVEFNLGHYKAAIDYYQRFLKTNPPADQAELAQQGLGAARAELDRPPPVKPPPAPPPPPPHHEFDTLDTVLTVTGGAALVASGVLFYESGQLSEDRTGSLAAYSHRIERAITLRDVGYGAAAGGALVLGAALLRWRLHLVDTTITVDASATGATVSLVRPL
jgi:tetratricopeptide (TPR) repeat protein